MLVGVKKFFASGFFVSLIFGLLWFAGGVYGLSTVNNDLAHYETLEKSGHKIVGKVVDISLEMKRYRSSNNDRITINEKRRISYNIEGKTYTITTTDRPQGHEKNGHSVGDEVNILADKENPAEARVEDDNAALRTTKYVCIAILSIGLLILIKCGIAIRRGEIFI